MGSAADSAELGQATESVRPQRNGTEPKDAVALPPLPVIATETPVTTPSSEAVACRAYELFLERGGEHGHDVEDWLRAERELRALEQQATLLTRELNEKPAN